MKADLEKDILPRLLGIFDTIIEKNNGYFVNGKLSLADIYLVTIMKHLVWIITGTVNYDIFEKYTNILALKKTLRTSQN